MASNLLGAHSNKGYEILVHEVRITIDWKIFTVKIFLSV